MQPTAPAQHLCSQRFPETHIPCALVKPKTRHFGKSQRTGRLALPPKEVLRQERGPLIRGGLGSGLGRAAPRRERNGAGDRPQAAAPQCPQLGGAPGPQTRHDRAQRSPRAHGRTLNQTGTAATRQPGGPSPTFPAGPTGTMRGSGYSQAGEPRSSCRYPHPLPHNPIWRHSRETSTSASGAKGRGKDEILPRHWPRRRKWALPRLKGGRRRV